MTYCISVCESCGVPLSRPDGEKTCPTCRLDPKPPQEGRRLDLLDVNPVTITGHEVMEVVGTGGMGAVHRARQESLQRDVAVKITAPERMSTEDRDRFLREARVLAQLDHPNIVPVHDFGMDAEGRCFYTMKLVRGRTLKAMVAAVRSGSESATLERMLEVFRKVCDAIAFAHSRGVLHRDLKPENIMVGEFGEVLVMDWGLAGEVKGGRRPMVSVVPPRAQVSTIDSDVALTLDGEVLGTPQYMSPEQANALPDLDERCDVYALGGILYSILTLRPPLSKGGVNEMLESVRTGRIEPFEAMPEMTESRTARWKIPPAMAAVVRKAMALERDDRFATVGELAEDVDAHLAGFATTAEDCNFARLFWLFIKRHRTVSIAALVLLIVSAGFVVQLLASERRATHSAAVARKNEDTARRAERAAHASAASTRIALADSAYAANDAGRMRATLDAVPADLRDTTWRYLDKRSDERQALVAFEGDSFLVGSAAHPQRPGVFAAATSADRHYIVTFEAKTGKILSKFKHRGGWVRGIAYSPDGKLIALARIQQEGVTIHNAEDGKELMHCPADWADFVTFLPDGKRLLMSDQTGCILWDVATGREIWKSDPGMTHLLVPGGERIASVSENNLRLVSVEDGSVLAKYPIGGVFPISSSLSPDGTLLVAGRHDGHVIGVRLADGEQVFAIPAGEFGVMHRTGFTPDGKRFVTASAPKDTVQFLQLRDAATGNVLRHLRGGAGNVESLTFQPLSGEMLITGNRSATWTLPQMREPRARFVDDRIVGGFIGKDELLLAPMPGHSFAAIDIRLKAIAWLPTRLANSISGVSADGRIGAVQVERWHDSIERKQLTVDPKTLPRTGSGTRNVLLFRAEGDKIGEFGTVRYGTTASFLALNRDGSRLALASAWGGLEAYRTPPSADLPENDQSEIRSFFALAWHGTALNRLIGIVTLRGRRGMAGCEEWLVSWDTDTGKRIAGVRNPTAMNCVASEPGGTRIAEAGDDKIVRLRDATTLAVIREFRAHDGPIQAIAWHPKRPILATSSTDRSVRLWDVETGRLIDEIHIGLREPEALHFSASGRRLAAMVPGDSTLVWQLE